jgi:hypothetical protein
MVHISALERLGKPVPTSGKERPYEPQNLLAVLRHIQATYSACKTLPGTVDIPVVDWSGEVLKPGEQAAGGRVLDVLQCASRRSARVKEVLGQAPAVSFPPVRSPEDDVDVGRQNHDTEVGAEAAD